MTNYQTSAEIQKYGCRALNNIAHENGNQGIFLFYWRLQLGINHFAGKNMVYIKEEGGIESIVAAMLRFPDNVDLLEGALGALRFVSGNTGNVILRLFSDYKPDVLQKIANSL